MKRVAFLLLLTISCGSTSIPDLYLKQLATMQARSVELTKKCQDLQRQLDENRAEQAWVAQRMETTAGEALTAMHLSSREFKVNLDKLKVERNK